MTGSPPVRIEAPSYIVTESEFLWLSPRKDMPEAIRQAVCEWARQHGLDPDQMPMLALIVRDVDRCQVRCAYFELDDQDRRVVLRANDDGGCDFRRVPHVAQGETPPMPWPDEVLALMKATDGGEGT